MKDIQFIEVGLENFGGYHEELSFPFENGKLIVITGPNGAGKTTIFDSLCYCLYGRTTKGGTGEDVINNIAKKNCRCWAKFIIDDQEYLVDRYVKYSKHGTTVYLYKGGEPIKKGHNEVVPYIDQILMPYKLFINTLMFTQKVKDFFTDLNDSAQKEIFRMVLLLNDYVIYQKKAGEKLKNIENTLIELEKETSINISLLNQIKQNIETIKLQKIEFEKRKNQELEDLKKEIENKLNNIKTTREELKKYNDLDLNKHKTDLLNHLTTIKNQADLIQKDVSSQIELITSRKNLKEKDLYNAANNKKSEQNEIISEEKSKYENFINKLQSEYNNSVHSITLEYRDSTIECTTIESTILSLSNDLKEYSESSQLTEGSICPTCKQLLSKDAHFHIKSKIQDITNKINELTKRKQDISSQAENIKVNKLNESKQKFDKLIEESKTQYSEKLKEYNNQISIIDNRLKTVLKQVEELSNSEIISATKDGQDKSKKLIDDENNINLRLQEINNKINIKESLEIEISRLENEERVLDDRYIEKERIPFDDSMIKELSIKEKEIENKLKELKKKPPILERKRQIYEFWKKDGFSSSGIPSMLIDESIPFMNRKVSEYSEQIAGGRYIITFDTLQASKDKKEYKDKINVEVFDTQTKSDKRVKFSGGQTRIVDIATILTLRDLQSNFQDMKINLILFDEIFDSLDDENIGYISKLLKTLAKDLCIVIISHRHFDSIEADEILRIGA